MPTQPISKTMETVPVAATLLGLAAFVLAIAFILHPDDSGTASDRMALLATSEVWTGVHFAIGAAFLVVAAACLVLLTRPNTLAVGMQPVVGIALLAVGAVALLPLMALEASAAPAVARSGDAALFEALDLFATGLLLLAIPTFALGALLLSLSQAVRPTLAPKWASYLAALAATAVIVGVVLGYGFGFVELQVLSFGALLVFLWLGWIGLRLGAQPTAAAVRGPAPG